VTTSALTLNAPWAELIFSSDGFCLFNQAKPF
jgi:hypothetical protein